MATNSNLQMSRSGRQDEFYTQKETVEKELWHYQKFFENKVVFCNADDPAIGEDGTNHYGDDRGGFASSFFQYFRLNFNHLGLKKLITTHYVSNGSSYKFEIVKTDKGNQIGIPDYIKTPLKGNGDFRSPECLELLKECDVVVTNPPFSLMKEYLPLMLNSGKQFLVLGNINHITFREIFHFFKDNQFWLGYNSGHFWFNVPEYYDEKGTDFRVVGAQKQRRMGNICWFTNIDNERRHQKLELYKHYSPEEYPTYDTYNAIDCKVYKEIPDDYYGVMGVPITYLPYHCAEQFEILGKFDGGTGSNDLDLAKPLVNGKSKYKRIAIQRKK
ncbi:MAG: adenine-specific methyltransferase EcoRI family protein [Acutalibacteraceae bacterium]